MHRVMVRNPHGGDGAGAAEARERAGSHGIDVRDSTEPGEAVTLAREAAGEADQILACGGDGTLNEVVRGIEAVGALDDVELADVPSGTGNNFARNVGVESVAHAFEVAESGDCRDLDLGVTDGDVFVNSCMGGLIAEASEDTDDDVKARIGSLAYALQTLSEARAYEGSTLEIRIGESHSPAWEGKAMVLLIGNGRRFFGDGRGQADIEDGRLEVVVVEDAPAMDFLADDALGRLLHRTPQHVTQLTTTELVVTTTDEPMSFSFDGEIDERSHLDAAIRPGAMQFRVGDAYEPDPPAWPAE